MTRDIEQLHTNLPGEVQVWCRHGQKGREGEREGRGQGEEGEGRGGEGRGQGEEGEGRGGEEEGERKEVDQALLR